MCAHAACHTHTNTLTNTHTTNNSNDNKTSALAAVAVCVSAQSLHFAVPRPPVAASPFVALALAGAFPAFELSRNEKFAHNESYSHSYSYSYIPK